MEIARLNIRQTLPRIGVHQTNAKLEMHSGKKPELHAEYKAPTGYGWTQPKIDIDSYPSRRAYGYSNHEDYARERGQEGIQKMRANMQKNNADAQAMVKNGAKKGHNEIVAQEKQRQRSQSAPPKGQEMKIPPAPTIRVTQKIEQSGEPDPGYYRTTVTPGEFNAHGEFTPAQVETYLKEKGGIDQWVTYGEYDRLA